jgi:CRISPR-associated protein Cas1
MQNRQLLVRLEKHGSEPERQTTIPIEDIGIVVLDNPQITLTHGLMAALLDNNASVITCDSHHMPVGLMLPLEGHTVQSERFQEQLSSSLPLRKQLWQQTVQQKILNQAALLRELHDAETGNMTSWVAEVRSGDSTNLEGRAAAYYWSQMFPDIVGFNRGRDGLYPNNFLNYGYAILRAVIARALVSSGLLPTFGIHHHNRYNAYCLADDIMEPYRPYIDRLVVSTIKQYPRTAEVTTDIKRSLLTIPTLEVHIGGQRSPLMVAASQTTASLARCFAGEIRKITYPEM